MQKALFVNSLKVLQLVLGLERVGERETAERAALRMASVRAHKRAKSGAELGARKKRTLPSDPFLKQLWLELRAHYFPGRADLDDYRVVWSGRKSKYALGSCNYKTRKVLVASAFKLEESARYLPALVYHEMCHAVLGKPEVVNGRRVIHGKRFKALERRHPGIRALNAWIKDGGWSKAARRWNRG